MESAKVIGALTRLTGDVGQAEDLAQDALLIALEKWPSTGIPDNPGAWLMGTAKHRAIDAMRRSKMQREKHDEVGRELDGLQERSTPDLDAALDDHGGDDGLSLIVIGCRPIHSNEAPAALTRPLLGGITSGEIARAFLSTESTIAQRIVRAKKTLADAKIPFEVPRGGEMDQRLPSVLEVIYLIFNEGYAATGGDDWVRPNL